MEDRGHHDTGPRVIEQGERTRLLSAHLVVGVVANHGRVAYAAFKALLARRQLLVELLVAASHLCPQLVEGRLKRLRMANQILLSGLAEDRSLSSLKTAHLQPQHGDERERDQRETPRDERDDPFCGGQLVRHGRKDSCTFGILGRKLVRVRRLGILAASGVGKTTLIQHLREDPRLDQAVVVDIDSFLPLEMQYDRHKLNSMQPPRRAGYWSRAELHAVRSVLNKRLDVMFGVMSHPETREMLQANGFSFALLSLPESVHRERLAARFSLDGGTPSAVIEQKIEEGVEIQRRLATLGYDEIDASRDVERTARNIARVMPKRDEERRLAILAAPGVGKTTLHRFLRTYPRVNRDPKLKTQLIADAASFLPDSALNGQRTPGETDVQLDQGTELYAVNAAMNKRVDVVFGLMNDEKPRALLSKRGFTFVVLSLPEALHLERIEARFKERGKVIDVKASIHGQRHLEGLGYDLIDASREVDEVARDIATKMLA